MEVRTLDGTGLRDIEDQLEQISRSSFSPSVAVVFSSPACAYTSIAQLLGRYGIQVFGCTTAGEIHDDKVLDASVVVMLLDPPPDTFKIYFSESGVKSTFNLGKALGHYATLIYDSPGILVLSAGLTRDGEELVEGITAGAQRNLPLFGGLAGDDFDMIDSFVFSHEHVTNDGIVALVVDQRKLQVRGVATSGWQPVGIEKTITMSEGNVIYRIDNQPALDVMIKYFGIDENIDMHRGIVETFGVQHPLFVYRADGSTVMRAPLLGCAEKRSIICAGGVAQGSKVKFGLPPTPDVIQDVIGDAESLKVRVPEVDALIMFSCKARHYALGPMMVDEVAGVRSVWEAPMVGLFTYGEIGAVRGQSCAFHNETCMLTTLHYRA